MTVEPNSDSYSVFTSPSKSSSLSRVRKIIIRISIYNAFNHRRIADKSIKTNTLLPEKTSVVEKLKIVTIISSSGTLVSFIGVEIILGVMFSKVVALEPGILSYDCTRFPNLFITSLPMYLPSRLLPI